MSQVQENIEKENRVLDEISTPSSPIKKDHGAPNKPNRPPPIPPKKIEWILNFFNHLLIISNASWMTYVGFNYGLRKTSLHGMLCTIGYQLLMAEAILCLYHANIWSKPLGREMRKRVHWIMMVVGSVFSISGIIVQFFHKGFHIASLHSWFGIISAGLLIFSMMNGTAALWADSIKQYISPLYNKSGHDFCGLVCFILGSLALYFGYDKKFMRRNFNGNFLLVMKFLTFLSICLTVIGSLKTLNKFFKAWKRGPGKRKMGQSVKND